jgi:hypothetical protein
VKSAKIMVKYLCYSSLTIMELDLSDDMKESNISFTRLTFPSRSLLSGVKLPENSAPVEKFIMTLPRNMNPFCWCSARFATNKVSDLLTLCQSYTACQISQG